MLKFDDPIIQTIYDELDLIDYSLDIRQQDDRWIVNIAFMGVDEYYSRSKNYTGTDLRLLVRDALTSIPDEIGRHYIEMIDDATND